MTTFEIYEQFKQNLWNENHSEDFVVCVCAKNEDEYVEEWIEHYLSLGFNKIVFADNNDKPGIEDKLRKYIDDGILYLVNCQGIDFYQVEFYTYFCRESNYKWCAYFDMDEFLEVPTNNIQELLSDVEGDVVCFHWLMYGCDGNIKKTDGRVQDRFKTPIFPILLTKENMFMKSIVRGGDSGKFEGCLFNGSHIPYITSDNGLLYNVGGTLMQGTINHSSFPLRYKYGYLKHYYTKSFEEWMIKSNRGWPDGTANLAADYFFVLNSCNVPIENFSKGLFCDNAEPDNNDFLDTYDVIQVQLSDSVFTFIKGISQLMANATSHTYVLTGNIDDTLYTICLENAIKTGNRLVYCKEDKVWDMYLKYSDGRMWTYYIITFY